MGHFSPLRYPGGKTQFYAFLRSVIRTNLLADGIYSEPYAGGGGLALKLLLRGDVQAIRLNDLNRLVYSFWKVLLTEPQFLIDFINTCPLTIEFYKLQKEILANPSGNQMRDIAAATLFINRTNRSGILDGGPIGCLLYTSPSPRDGLLSRMPSSA